MIDLPPRFWAKVETTGHDGCWIWTGCRHHDGYGWFNNSAKRRPSWLAHRLAYLALIGDIPENLVLDHLCSNPPCVNPWHLEAVPQGTNMLRAAASVNAKHAAVTHCPQGHEYTSANTRVSDGMRFCRICNRVSSRERQRRKGGYYLRHPEEVPLEG